MQTKREDDPSPLSGVSNTSRRRVVRFEPQPNLRIAIAGTAARLAMQDIGTGGVGVLSDLPLKRGALLEVTLTLGAVVVKIQARAVHCRRQADGRWMLGL